ncbi:MAG TPA: hypothetical protein VGQ83_34330 [Polyangia bacterium]|jgi:hypothetical protein
MRRASLVLATILAVGCGGGSSGPSATAACTSRATASCALRDSCSSGHGVAARYGDPASCVSREAQACESNLRAPGTHVTPATVAACATGLPGQACADFWNNVPIPACLPPAGARANGQPCGAPGQCQSTYCALPKGAACGLCADLPAAGAPCVNTGETVRGFTCARTTGTWAPLGASGSACNDDSPCGAGFACVGAAGSATTCEAQPTATGAACDARRTSAADCDRTLGVFCTGHTGGVCAPITYVGGGAACGRLDQGDGGAGGADGGAGAFTVAACTAGALCVLEAGVLRGACVAPAAEGAACDTDLGPPCLAPARCVGSVSDGGTTTGTCQLIDPASCG